MNYLLSYPRSGNSWLRYCIEVLTKKRTAGYLAGGRSIETSILKSNAKKPIFLTKRHRPQDCTNITKKDSLILLVRNYKEVVIRHKGKSKSIMDEGSSLQNVDTAVSYLKLLRFYHCFKGPKLIVYYEDLILRPFLALEEVLNFLNRVESKKSLFNSILQFFSFGSTRRKLNRFIDRYEEHKQKSIKRYKTVAGSRTKGDKVIHHSKNTPRERKLKMERFLKKNFPVVYCAYLKRYDEPKI
jgi:hypothetical protein